MFEPGMPGDLPDTAFLHTKVDVVRDSIECQKSMKHLGSRRLFSRQDAKQKSSLGDGCRGHRCRFPHSSDPGMEHAGCGT